MGLSNKNTFIPPFDLKRQNERLKPELSEVFSDLVDSGMFVLGENVKALEQEILSYCGSHYGIGVASGSDALYLSLLACGIGQGDEVITTPFTFFATAGSIERTGAKPVFVDINLETYNMEPSLIEEKITSKTKAILPVHLYGCPADMDPIMDIAKQYGLKVIEDAAQAIGAEYKGRQIGSIGDAGCFSFFPTKNLGAFGDGGMVVTSNSEIAKKVRMLRVHGSKKKYYHEILGCNSRLDEIQAAILRVKLKYLQEWNENRRRIADSYNKLFCELNITGDIKLPVEPEYAHTVYHQYTISVDNRDEFKEYMKDEGVGSTVYYPVSLHLQEVFDKLGYKLGDFPNSEKASEHVLSLPMFPELTGKEIEYAAEAATSFFES